MLVGCRLQLSLLIGRFSCFSCFKQIHSRTGHWEKVNLIFRILESGSILKRRRIRTPSKSYGSAWKRACHVLLCLGEGVGRHRAVPPPMTAKLNTNSKIVQRQYILRSGSDSDGDVCLVLQTSGSVEAACNLASSRHRRLTSSGEPPPIARGQ